MIFSIDPGQSTGVVLARATEDKLDIVEKWQVEGGLDGLALLMAGTHIGHDGKIIAEKFLPRQMARAYKAEELEPLRIEGFLEASFPGRVTYRTPGQRRLIKGDDLRPSEDFLRFAGLWTTGSEVGRKDANDVNSAMMHLVSYLREQKHRPVLDLLVDYRSRSVT